MKLGAVRSDLTLEEEPLSVVEGLVGGFRGTLVSMKIPKVIETDASFHLHGDIGREEDAGSRCHQTRCMDS